MNVMSRREWMRVLLVLILADLASSVPLNDKLRFPQFFEEKTSKLRRSLPVVDLDDPSPENLESRSHAEKNIATRSTQVFIPLSLVDAPIQRNFFSPQPHVPRSPIPAIDYTQILGTSLRDGTLTGFTENQEPEVYQEAFLVTPESPLRRSVTNSNNFGFGGFSDTNRVNIFPFSRQFNPVTKVIYQRVPVVIKVIDDSTLSRRKGVHEGDIDRVNLLSDKQRGHELNRSSVTRSINGGNIFKYHNSNGRNNAVKDGSLFRHRNFNNDKMYDPEQRNKFASHFDTSHNDKVLITDVSNPEVVQSFGGFGLKLSNNKGEILQTSATIEGKSLDARLNDHSTQELFHPKSLTSLKSLEKGEERLHHLPAPPGVSNPSNSFFNVNAFKSNAEKLTFNNNKHNRQSITHTKATSQDSNSLSNEQSVGNTTEDPLDYVIDNIDEEILSDIISMLEKLEDKNATQKSTPKNTSVDTSSVETPENNGVTNNAINTNFKANGSFDGEKSVNVIDVSDREPDEGRNKTRPDISPQALLDIMTVDEVLAYVDEMLLVLQEKLLLEGKSNFTNASSNIVSENKEFKLDINNTETSRFSISEEKQFDRPITLNISNTEPHSSKKMENLQPPIFNQSEVLGINDEINLNSPILNSSSPLGKEITFHPVTETRQQNLPVSESYPVTTVEGITELETITEVMNDVTKLIISDRKNKSGDELQSIKIAAKLENSPDIDNDDIMFYLNQTDDTMENKTANVIKNVSLQVNMSGNSDATLDGYQDYSKELGFEKQSNLSDFSETEKQNSPFIYLEVEGKKKLLVDPLEKDRNTTLLNKIKTAMKENISNDGKVGITLDNSELLNREINNNETIEESEFQVTDEPLQIYEEVLLKDQGSKKEVLDKNKTVMKDNISNDREVDISSDISELLNGKSNNNETIEKSELQVTGEPLKIHEEVLLKDQGIKKDVFEESAKINNEPLLINVTNIPELYTNVESQFLTEIPGETDASITPSNNTQERGESIPMFILSSDGLIELIEDENSVTTIEPENFLLTSESMELNDTSSEPVKNGSSQEYFDRGESAGLDMNMALFFFTNVTQNLDPNNLEDLQNNETADVILKLEDYDYFLSDDGSLQAHMENPSLKDFGNSSGINSSNFNANAELSVQPISPPVIDLKDLGDKSAEELRHNEELVGIDMRAHTEFQNESRNLNLYEEKPPTFPNRNSKAPTGKTLSEVNKGPNEDDQINLKMFSPDFELENFTNDTSIENGSNYSIVRLGNATSVLDFHVKNNASLQMVEDFPTTTPTTTTSLLDDEVLTPTVAHGIAIEMKNLDKFGILENYAHTEVTTAITMVGELLLDPSVGDKIKYNNVSPEKRIRDEDNPVEILNYSTNQDDNVNPDNGMHDDVIRGFSVSPVNLDHGEIFKNETFTVSNMEVSNVPEKHVILYPSSEVEGSAIVQDVISTQNNNSGLGNLDLINFGRSLTQVNSENNVHNQIKVAINSNNYNNSEFDEKLFEGNEKLSFNKGFISGNGTLMVTELPVTQVQVVETTFQPYNETNLITGVTDKLTFITVNDTNDELKVVTGIKNENEAINKMETVIGSVTSTPHYVLEEVGEISSLSLDYDVTKPEDDDVDYVDFRQDFLTEGKTIAEKVTDSPTPKKMEVIEVFGPENHEFRGSNFDENLYLGTEIATNDSILRNKSDSSLLSKKETLNSERNILQIEDDRINSLEIIHDELSHADELVTYGTLDTNENKSHILTNPEPSKGKTTNHSSEIVSTQLEQAKEYKESIESPNMRNSDAILDHQPLNFEEIIFGLRGNGLKEGNFTTHSKSGDSDVRVEVTVVSSMKSVSVSNKTKTKPIEKVTIPNIFKDVKDASREELGNSNNTADTLTMVDRVIDNIRRRQSLGEVFPGKLHSNDDNKIGSSSDDANIYNANDNNKSIIERTLGELRKTKERKSSFRNIQDSTNLTEAAKKRLAVRRFIEDLRSVMSNVVEDESKDSKFIRDLSATLPLLNQVLHQSEKGQSDDNIAQTEAELDAAFRLNSTISNLVLEKIKRALNIIDQSVNDTEKEEIVGTGEVKNKPSLMNNSLDQILKIDALKAKFEGHAFPLQKWTGDIEEPSIPITDLNNNSHISTYSNYNILPEEEKWENNPSVDGRLIVSNDSMTPESDSPQSNATAPSVLRTLTEEHDPDEQFPSSFQFRLTEEKNSSISRDSDPK